MKAQMMLAEAESPEEEGNEYGGMVAKSTVSENVRKEVAALVALKQEKLQAIRDKYEVLNKHLAWKYQAEKEAAAKK